MALLRLGELRAPQLAELAADPDAIGLLPLGSIEQHGPHLPVGTDSVIAVHIADEIAARVEAPVLVAPGYGPGMSSHHLGFPGTVDLPEAAFVEVLRAYVRMFTALGLTKVAMFSSHGGNFATMGAVARELDGADGVMVAAFDDLPAYLNIMVRAASRAGTEVPACDIHAGGLETSQMLYLERHGIVHGAEGLEGYVDAEPGWLDRMFDDGIEALSPIGVLGRPAVASAPVGQRICAALADELAAWISATFALPTVPVAGSEPAAAA